MVLVGNSYLTAGDNEVLWYWGMTPAGFGGDCSVMSGVSLRGLGSYKRVSDRYAVRPVINVTTNNGFASGDGTAQNPYILNAE